MKLSDRACVDLPKGSPALSLEAIGALVPQLDGAWRIADNALKRRWETRNFAQALDWANQLGALAEAEGHHPDITLGWGYVTVAFTTHSVGGLSDNDFICAAKIDLMEPVG